jgi:hypothetical protein
MSEWAAAVFIGVIVFAAMLIGLFTGMRAGEQRGLEAAGQAGAVPVQCVGRVGWHLSCEVAE